MNCSDFILPGAFGSNTTSYMVPVPVLYTAEEIRILSKLRQCFLEIGHGWLISSSCMVFLEKCVYSTAERVTVNIFYIYFRNIRLRILQKC
jgi:hypothetical protein